MNGLVVVNIVLGGVALLAVYTVARRLLGPVWSLLPSTILGVSMPMVYFSRGTYTEVVSLALFFAAITWLWSAFRTGRRQEFFFAGVLAGATSETRIDGVLGVAAMVVAFLLVILGIARPRLSIPLGRAFALFALPAVVITAFSVYDFETNFHTYVTDLGSQTKALWVLFALVTVLTAVVLLVQRVVASSRGGRPAPFLLGGELGDRGATGLGTVLGAIVPLTFAFWAVRPALFHVHGGNSPSVQAVVEGLQRAAGAPVDGTRTYDEWSLYWFVWYFGLPFLLAAGIGLGLLVRRAVARHEPGLLVLTALTFAVSLLYLDKMSITPDQSWAFRRALPLIAPGFVIASVEPIRLLAGRVKKRSVRFGRLVAAMCIVLVVGGTVSAWTPRTFGTINGNGQAAEISAICSRLGDAKDVVLVNLGPDPYGLGLKTFCGVDVVMVSTGPVTSASTAATTAHLKELATRLDPGTPVVTSNESTVPWQKDDPTPLVTAHVKFWTSRLIGAPNEISESSRTTWIGTLTADGTVADR
ncbi:hypothetical protein GCM10025867_37450 [Frondihabitans sucicola]|uniref:Glycosyltransferase RgtA/B/C/D-like domain-containing protein n=1 Tax=Frondihabitans sucicola TaxID=1268041 RepID=A0ABM8GSR3_9MICO|nr:glycosyltransferase family 39 protein [Frondihabitans sucicola]BDZ51504.1 hypothetical protein GCM10025867_37450 [Frondihabitans sucicola]